jgi:replication fork clamp-binding protein CrfC
MDLPIFNALQTPVQRLIDLLMQEDDLRSHLDLTPIQTSLQKVLSPTFEIVFAGAFSAGKSMLINALLERELLYSAEGHATGTECRVAYAECDRERVILTFLSLAEIQEQLNTLHRQLRLKPIQLPQTAVETQAMQVIQMAQTSCLHIIKEEGGESKSERAKQATALHHLLTGFLQNCDRIDPVSNNTFSMDQLHLATLQEASQYTRRGYNSAVLKRIEYYCHHELLQDGNILIDTPGIDAPVKKDAELTYSKLEHPDTSAVICVLKPAATGDLTSEETQLLERMRSNPGIRDRVFYVFNRIDETWYNIQLRQRLEQLIREQFHQSQRVLKTSGLLGFFGSQIRMTGGSDRFGLDSIFREVVHGEMGEETPQFISEFNRYCANSGKLPVNRFRIEVKSYESPNQNYVRILTEQGTPLIEQLIQDSGIEEFRQSVTHYLAAEKRPLLFTTLVADLQPLCTALHQFYTETSEYLAAQPLDVEAIKEQELRQVSRSLQQISEALRQDLSQQVNEIVASNQNVEFEQNFSKLKARLVTCLDELIHTFSVSEVHKRAQSRHQRHSVVPLLGILTEAFYYLADGLEAVLVESAQDLIVQCFETILTQIQQRHYYRDLLRILGDDADITQSLRSLQIQVMNAVANEAKIECDRYVRERPEFYAEKTASMWQLRQTLEQACRGYDYQSMVDAEPAIRQLLKLDFEQKVTETVRRSFRQTLNQTLNTHVLSYIEHQTTVILQQHDRACLHLVKVLEQEAIAKVQSNQQRRLELQEKITQYNQAITAIHDCSVMLSIATPKLPMVIDVGGIMNGRSSSNAPLEMLEPTH